MADFQDYTPRVIGSKTISISSANKEAKAGQKKTPGSTGLSGKLDNQTAAKLDSDEAKAPETVGLDVGKAISAARNAKGWKVTELANALNVQKSVILDLESGRHTKDNKLMQSLEKKLGVWLTGDAERIGTPKTRGSKDKKEAETKKPAAKGTKAAKASEDKQKEEVRKSESDSGTEETKKGDGEEGREAAKSS